MHREHTNTVLVCRNGEERGGMWGKVCHGPRVCECAAAHCNINECACGCYLELGGTVFAEWLWWKWKVVRLGERSKVKVILGVDARRNVDVKLKCFQEVPLQLIATHYDTHDTPYINQLTSHRQYGDGLTVTLLHTWSCRVQAIHVTSCL